MNSPSEPERQFDEVDSSPNHEIKLGIVGADRAGKTYVMEALLHRAFSRHRVGALAPFLTSRESKLYRVVPTCEDPPGNLEAQDELSLSEEFTRYRKWKRLPSTGCAQRGYRLRLFYQPAVSRVRRTLDVHLLDGHAQSLREEPCQAWYADARVMVFCLPARVALPTQDAGSEQRQARKKHLAEFKSIVHSFRDLRERSSHGSPVVSILALTMADEPCCHQSFEKFQADWIHHFQNPTDTGRYLSGAYDASERLRSLLTTVDEDGLSPLLSQLKFGSGEPWIIPMSAIDGTQLQNVEAGEPAPEHPPVPVHVELPLLAAFCEHTNALI